jgi:MOSC domain-containing protein YiiM
MSTWQGRVHSLYSVSASAAPMQAVDAVEAIAGRGLEGDRYCAGAGTFSEQEGSGRQVTLVELEAIDALAAEDGIVLEPGATRRNIVTEGVPLNHLVEREFRVGEAVLRGTRLCEPCGHLQRLSGIDGLAQRLLHRAGLRADIVAGGTIRVGDEVGPR